MPLEDPHSVDGWTIDTLKVYLEALISSQNVTNTQRFLDLDKATQVALIAQEKAVTAALASAERAVIKAEIAAEKRFDSVNEFRQQLSDQTATFIARREYEANYESLNEKVSGLAERANKTDGHSSGLNAGWVIIVSIIVVIGIVVNIILRK